MSNLLWVHYPDGCVSDEIGEPPQVGEHWSGSDGTYLVERVEAIPYDPEDDEDDLGPASDVFLKKATET